MNFSSTSKRSYWLILGMSTFLAVVGISVSIWSIGSLKYQIKHLNDVEHKLISNLAVFEERFSQLISTVQKQNTNFEERFLQVNSTVKKLSTNFEERFSLVNSTVQIQKRNFKEALLQLKTKVKQLQGKCKV